MITHTVASPDGEGDGLLERTGRWVFAKVWFACVLSGLYAFTRHIGWPEALVTLFAVLGAVGLAVAANWLPIWTREHTTGFLFLDVVLKVVVWAGLTVAVASLLVGDPAVGSVAGALLLTAAWRTFRPERTAPTRGRIGAVRPRHRGPEPRRDQPP